MKNVKKNENKYIVGVDVGGTTCKIALFDSDIKMIKKWQIDTVVENGGKNIIENCAKSIIQQFAMDNLDKNNLLGIGVVVPGPVNDEGIVIKAVNLGWKKPYNITKEMEKYFYKGIIVKVANDANAAAYGEYKYINDAKIHSLVMVTLGTGIGGGLIYKGRICNGKNGTAMEIGHIRTDFSKSAKKCNCGGIGCVETVSATNAIRKQFVDNLKNKKLSKINSIFRKCKKEEIEKIYTKDICDMAKKGDELCIYTLKNAMNYIGQMLANITLVLNPDIIVIGGGISNTGNIITKYIKEGIKENGKMLTDMPIIKISKLKNDAGMYGAGYLVKN